MLHRILSTREKAITFPVVSVDAGASFRCRSFLVNTLVKSVNDRLTGCC